MFSRLSEQVKTKFISKIIYLILNSLEIYFDIYHYEFTGSLEDNVRIRRDYVLFYYGDEYLEYANSRRSKKLIKDKTEEEWLESELKYLNEFIEMQEKNLENW